MFVIAGAGEKCTLSNEVMHYIVKIWSLNIRQDPKKQEVMEMKRYAGDIIDLHYRKYCQTTRSRLMPQLQMLLERI